MRFKQGINKDEYSSLHPKTREVAEFIDLCLKKLGDEAEVTSMIRPHTTDSGIHATGRALDCVGRGTSIEKCQRISEFVNFLFKRKSGYPSCLFHDAGTGYHFHVQVDKTDDFKDLTEPCPTA